MLTLDVIQSSVHQVAPLFDIKKVVLFGSYAEGTQTEDSDVDLLVEFIQPSVSIYKLAGAKLRLQDMIGKQVDLIHSPIPPGALIEVNKEVLLYDKAG